METLVLLSFHDQALDKPGTTHKTHYTLKHFLVFWVVLYKRRNQIPFVIISRRDGLIDKLKGHLVGASDYVVKPFTVAQLISIVQSHLGASKTELVPV